MNPFSDLPEWVWDVELGGWPKLFREQQAWQPDWMYDAYMWRWPSFICARVESSAVVREASEQHLRRD